MRYFSSYNGTSFIQDLVDAWQQEVAPTVHISKAPQQKRGKSKKVTLPDDSGLRDNSMLKQEFFDKHIDLLQEKADRLAIKGRIHNAPPSTKTTSLYRPEYEEGKLW